MMLQHLVSSLGNIKLLREAKEHNLFDFLSSTSWAPCLKFLLTQNSCCTLTCGSYGGRTAFIVLYQTSLILRFNFDIFNNFGSFWAAFGIKH